MAPCGRVRGVGSGCVTPRWPAAAAAGLGWWMCAVHWEKSVSACFVCKCSKPTNLVVSCGVRAISFSVKNTHIARTFES